ncbi:MAG: hypothetical protein JSV75_00015 [Candidatus Bathyarchaeota archaeon]|nr:MAG: hypothetical protein JSV75_00015 [Candidatus Bathyarchaeota archaeon]
MEKMVGLSRRVSWKIICGAAFSLLLMGSFLGSAKAEELITTPLEELLPPEDLPSPNPYEWEFKTLVNSTLGALGFVEGRKATYTQTLFQVAEKDVYFYVYRFIDGDSAKTYYDNQVDAMRAAMQGVNATELAIPGAFAILYEYDLEQEATSLGYLSNIVFKIYLYNDFRDGFWVFPRDALRTAPNELTFFTNLQTSIIPEFPTFILFPLLMIATLLVVVFFKRKHL